MANTQLKVLQQEIAASLWMLPATLEELKTREFLSHMDEYSVWTVLNMAIKRNWVYSKGDVYHCYKSAAIELNKDGYELNV